LVTTTPKPIRLLRDLLALEGHGVVITRDSTLANAANLPPALPGTSGADDGDSVGIVICGKGVDGLFYVIGDWSCKLSPAGWGRRAVAAIKFSKLVAGGRGTGIEPSPPTPSYRSV